MTLIPAEPRVPDTQRDRGSLLLRYDDISQSGHLLITPMPFAIGQVSWPAILKQSWYEALRADRIVPILSRFIVESGAAPLSVDSAIEAEASFHFAHTLSAEGTLERLMLNMWCDIYGTAGRTHGPPPSNVGEKLLAGRVFAEHVFTRPFDPPESRRVVELNAPGLPRIPPDGYAWRAPEMLMDVPAGATWVDDGWTVDVAPIVFGLDHTDSNQHVNSLVYPRLFIDASLRAWWDRGKRMALRAESIEIAYRKPSFAGDRVRIASRAFKDAQRMGAALILVTDKEASALDAARPRVFARVWLGEE